jgi:hypothetical protein
MHAVSRDVRKLEDRAGTPLFDRTSRQVALTPAGRRLLVRARQILALHDETLSELPGEGRSLLVDVIGQRLTPRWSWPLPGPAPTDTNSSSGTTVDWTLSCRCWPATSSTSRSAVGTASVASRRKAWSTN